MKRLILLILFLGACALHAYGQRAPVEHAYKIDLEYLRTLSPDEQAVYRDWAINGTYNEKYDARRTAMLLETATPEERVVILREQEERRAAYLIERAQERARMDPVNATRREAAQQREAFGEQRVVHSCLIRPGEEPRKLYRYMFPEGEPDTATKNKRCDELRLNALRQKAKVGEQSNLDRMMTAGFTPSIDTRMQVSVLDQAGEVTMANFDSTFVAGEEHNLSNILPRYLSKEGIPPGKYQYVLYLNGEHVETLPLTLR